MKLRYVVSRRYKDGEDDSMSPYWVVIDRNGQYSFAGCPCYCFEACMYTAQRANDDWFFKGKAYG